MSSITQLLTPLIEVPSLSDPDTFETRAEALFNVKLPLLGSEINTVISQMNVVTDEVNANALAVAANTVLADGYRIQAAASASAAAASASIVTWTVGGSFAQYALAISPADKQVYRRNTAGSGGADPSLNLGTWTRITGPNLGVGGVAVSGSTTLTVNSVGVQYVTPTGYGQGATLPDATLLYTGINLFAIANAGDYPYAIKANGGALLGYVMPGQTVLVSLQDKSTAAGVWSLLGHEWYGVDVSFMASLAATIGSSRSTTVVTVDGIELILIHGATNLEAIAYDPATGSIGAPATLYAEAVTKSQVLAVRNAANQCLVVSAKNDTLRSVVLSLVGVAITVNNLATKVVGTSSMSTGSMDDGYKIVQAGSTFAFGFQSTNVSNVSAFAIALTISGTAPAITCAIGTEQLLLSTPSAPPIIELVSSTHILAVSMQTTGSFSFRSLSVSGNALTPGTAANLACGAQTSTNYIYRKLGTRWALVYNNATVLAGAIISVSGTTVTTSTAALAAFAAAADHVVVAQHSDRLIVAAANGTSFATNCLVDVSGTATPGTAVTRTIATGGVRYVRETATELMCSFKSTIDGYVVASIGYSGNNPVINRYQMHNDSMLGTTQRLMAVASDDNWLAGRDYSGHALYTDSTDFSTVAAQNCSLSTGKALRRAPRLDIRGGVTRLTPNVRWVITSIGSGSTDVALTRVTAAA